MTVEQRIYWGFPKLGVPYFGVLIIRIRKLPYDIPQDPVLELLRLP